MKKKFLELIKSKDLLKKGDGLVLGVSGGADSMTMLHLFCSIRQECDLRLHVVHLNHMFRGKDADDDEEYVKNICKEWNVECFSFRRNVLEIAKANKICFEDAGRNERYGLFEEIRERTFSQKIAVAQNRNDQAETVLMHLFRGTGLDGLTGIEFSRDDIIIRPIMIFSRIEIEKYCEINGIIPRVDKTNFQSDYQRNKIRLELIPYIEENVNPKIIDAIFRTTELLNVDKDFIDGVVIKESERLLRRKKEKILLDIKEFNKLSAAIRSRIVRNIIKEIKGDLKEVTQKHIKEVLELSNKGKTGTHKKVVDKVFFLISYDNLIVYKSDNSIKNFELGEISFIELTIEEFKSFKLNENQIAVDKDEIFGKIYVRTRKDGDKFCPKGLSGSKKIKDFFIDMKIERELRGNIPIVCDEANILWIVGFRQDSRFEVKEKTSKVLILQYYRL